MRARAVAQLRIAILLLPFWCWAQGPAPVGPVLIGGQPQNQMVIAPAVATFSATAVGTAPITYQWNRNGLAIGGATSPVYTTPATGSTDAGATFTVTVTNVVNSFTSAPAMLTVTSAPVAPAIVGQPQNVQVSQGETAPFYVFATGTGPLSYQWKKNGTAVSGATSASYTTPVTASADNSAQFTVTVTNSAGSITSAAAALSVTSTPAGLGGFSLPRPGYYGANNDLIGVRYRFRVVTNDDPRGKILFGFNSLYTPGAAVGGYDIESNVYSWRTSFADGGCTTYPPLGASTFGEASLRNATADYPYGGGTQPAVGSAVNTSDAYNWPVQTYLVDNIRNLYKSDSISQVNINGVETLVTIQRGGTLTDVSGFTRCGLPMLSTTYRVWTVTTQMAGRAPVVNDVVAPDADARYIVPAQALQFASEFLAQPGAFAVQYWDLAYLTESNPVWTSATNFMTSAFYDGTGQDFGIHVVSVNGQDRLEFSNVPGNSYLSGNLPFSIAPASCTYSLNPGSLLSPAAGGNFSVAIQTGCSWAVSGLPGWISAASVSGNGTGTIALVVAPNATGETRNAAISIAGISFVVNEAVAGGSTVPAASGDFGTNNSFSTSNGWCVTGAATSNCGPEATRHIAAPFVPGSTFTVSSIAIPLSWSGGTNGTVINLMSTSPGAVPGAVLESWSVSGLPSGAVVTSVLSKLNPALQTGQTYWVEAEPLAADTFLYWYNNNLGLPGGMTNINQAGWTALSGSGSLPAFSVTGSSIQVAQTITFGALGNTMLGVRPFAVAATASSGLTVGFASATSSVCTMSGSTVVVTAAGTCSIIASQTGNANYTAAPPVTRSFTVGRRQPPRR